MKGQCLGKMEQFQKSLMVFTEMGQDLLEEVESIGFKEEFFTNFIAQMCYFVLTLKEYQKRELLTEFNVSLNAV